MKNLITLLALLFLIHPSANSQTPSQAKHFHAAIELAADGKVFAKPNFIVKEGSTASIIADRPDGYSLRFELIAPSASDTPSRTMSMALYLPDAGKWVLVARPTLTAEINRVASVTYQRAGQSPLSLKIVLTDNFKGKILADQSSFGKNSCSLAKLAAWQARMEQPVKPFPKLSKIQFEQIGGCCSAGCNMTCCSDGPMCCSDPYICEGGAQCCNNR